MRPSEAIAAVLADADVDIVAGMPGGYTVGLYEALAHHETIRVVQVREESIATLMADAYGRLRGKPMVVMGQGEWIAGNAGQGLLESWLGSAPVVVLTEMSDGGSLSHHAPYQAGTGEFGTWDAVGTLRGMTKQVWVAQSPAQAVQQTQLAFKHATTGQPGPVAVIYTSRSLRGQVSSSDRPRLHEIRGYLPTSRRGWQGEEIAAVLDAIGAAAAPVFLVGNGVRVGAAKEALFKVAETLGVPVVTTSGGKGVFPEEHPLCAGVMGTFGNAVANGAVQAADLIIAVGTKLAPIDTADENPQLIDVHRQRLFQLDIEPLHVGWTHPVERGFVGEAADFFTDLAIAAGGRPGSGRNGVHTVASLRAAVRGPVGQPAEGSEFAPRDVVETLSRSVPAGAVVTCDAGENRLFMLQWFRTRRGIDYLQPAAGGGMGYAVPAAMGARLAFPSRPAVAVCGDGGFAMSLHALMSAVQERIPLTVVIFNNRALGWVLHGMHEQPVAARLDEFDHVAIARALGCEGIRVCSLEELATEVEDAASRTRPTVLDVPVSLATTFHDVVQPVAASRWKSGD